MYQISRGVVISGTCVLFTMILSGSTASAQTFAWKPRAVFNSPNVNSTNHSSWDQTRGGRLTLSSPTSAAGRLRLYQPTSAQGRLQLAPSANPQGRLRLQTPANSTPAQSDRQQRVESFVQKQLQQSQSEHSRRRQILEHIVGKPAKTTVMPLNNSTPQPTVLVQFKVVEQDEDDE